MIVDSLRTVAGYPLRQLGLDPGHADRQFQPSAARTRAAGIEQFAYPTGRIAAEDERVAVLTRPTGCDKPTNAPRRVPWWSPATPRSTSDR